MASALTQPAARTALYFVGIVILVFALMAINRVVQRHFGELARQATIVNALSLPAALAKAQESDQLVLIELSALWCPTCRKLDQSIFNQPRVKEAIEHDFVFATVDYDSPEGSAFMREYQVAGVPILLVLNAEAQKLVRLPITFDASEFIGQLNRVVSAQQAALTPAESQ